MFEKAYFRDVAKGWICKHKCIRFAFWFTLLDLQNKTWTDIN